MTLRSLCASCLHGALAAAPVHAQGADAPPTRLQVIHNAPDPALAAVDVYVDGVRLPDLDDVRFREATPFFGVEPGGTLTVAVAPDTSTGTDAAYLRVPVRPLAGLDTYVVLLGVLDPSAFAPNPDGVSTALQLRVRPIGPGGVTAGTGEPRVPLSLFHGAPDLRGYRFSLLTADGSGMTTSYWPYEQTWDNLRYPVDDFVYDVALSDGRGVRITAASVGAAAESPVALLASGFADPRANGDGPPLAFLAVYEDGAVRAFRVAPPVTAEPGAPPAALVLAGPVPNPAGARAVLTLRLAHDAEVELDVRDALGRRVWSAGRRRLSAGLDHRLALELGGVAPGAYVYRVTAHGPSGPVTASGWLTVAR